jgi:hypothetical protein
MSFSSSRNWFPVIIAGLTVMLAILFYATNRSIDVNAWMSSVTDDGDANGAVGEETSLGAPTEDEYQQAVRTILAKYTEDTDAQAAYDAFIQLDVPAAMQSFHIRLIVTFGKLASSAQTDGEARFQALIAQYSWLSL